ncbi:unnamed protein product [Closterium sp. NIES-54]
MEASLEKSAPPDTPGWVQGRIGGEVTVCRLKERERYRERERERERERGGERERERERLECRTLAHKPSTAHRH